MDNLTYFNTEAEYNEFLSSKDYKTPNVSLINTPKSVRYNPAEVPDNHVDKAGLKQLGWSDQDILEYDNFARKYSEDACFKKVNEYDKSQYGILNKETILSYRPNVKALSLAGEGGEDSCMAQLLNPQRVRNGTIVNIVDGDPTRDYDTFVIKKYVIVDKNNLKDIKLGYEDIDKGEPSVKPFPELVHLPFFDTSGVTSMGSYTSEPGYPGLNLSVPAFFGQCEEFIFLGVGTNGPVYSGYSKMIAMPKLDTSSTESFYETFKGCTELRYIPLLDTRNAKDTSYMFKNCVNLKRIPNFNFENVEYCFGMFEGCGVEELVGFNFKNCGKTPREFYSYNDFYIFGHDGSPYIKKVDITIGDYVVGVSRLFHHCTALKEVNINIEKCESVYGLFEDCKSLEIIPDFSIPLVTTTNSMFLNCSSLKRVNLLNTEQITSIKDMFNGCGRLKEIGLMKLPKVVNNADNTLACTENAFKGCYNLEKVGGFPGIQSSLNFSDCLKLTPESIDNILNNLPDLTGIANNRTVLFHKNIFGKIPKEKISALSAIGWTIKGTN